MQVNTIVKMSSLALDVAQDEKIRQLVTMVHKGAKRRGIIGQPMHQNAPPVHKPTTATPPPIPFAPQQTAVAQQPTHMPHNYGGSGFGKYLTAENAQKALGWANVVKNILVK